METMFNKKWLPRVNCDYKFCQNEHQQRDKYDICIFNKENYGLNWEYSHLWPKGTYDSKWLIVQQNNYQIRLEKIFLKSFINTKCTAKDSIFGTCNDNNCVHRKNYK